MEIAKWQEMSPAEITRKRWWRIRLFLLFIFATSGFCPAVSAGELENKESLIKAGFITKFPAYITWPAAEVRQTRPAFRYCVLGPDAIAEHLRSLVKLSNNRPRNAQVRVVEQISESLPCEVLFIPDHRAHAISEIVSTLGTRAVLLIGETPGLARQGAHINLYRAEGRVKFEINRSSVEKSGLQISFRLLELARVIE